MKEFVNRIMGTGFMRSIFRVGMPETDRDKMEAMISSFFLHIHSAKIKPNSLKWNYTFGLGLISIFLFTILSFTGILLMIYYIPSTTEAYNSMKDIQFTTTFGVFIRNVHRWSAHGMVLAVFLHMCRVFYTGSFKNPREFNWVIGVILLILTLGLSFTGYLLPWDQLAYWAITVGTSIASYVPLFGEKIRWLLLGDQEVGQAALLRFYTFHVIMLPAITLFFIFFHIWRVRKDGGLSSLPSYEVNGDSDEVVGKEKSNTKTYGLMALIKGNKVLPKFKGESKNEIFSWPNLFMIEITLFFLTILVVSILSLFFNAPLEQIADPSHPTNPAKAPWYFLWLQELVSYSAFIGGVVTPTILVLSMILLPYFNQNPEGVGVFFHKSRKIAITLFTIIIIAVIILTVIGLFFRGPNWILQWWPY